MSQERQQELTQILDESGLPTVRTDDISLQFKEFFDAAGEWKEKAEALKVTNDDQVEEMAEARKGRLIMRDKRTGIDKTRKRLNAHIIIEQKTVNKLAKILTEAISPIEKYLGEQENFVKLRREAEEKAEYDAFLKDKAEKEEKDRIAAEKKAAEDKAEADKLAEAQRLENEKLKKEAKEREEKIAEEKADREQIERGKEILRKKKEAALKAESDKNAKDAREAKERADQAERDAKAAKEDAERLEKEKQDREDQDAQEATHRENHKKIYGKIAPPPELPVEGEDPQEPAPIGIAEESAPAGGTVEVSIPAPEPVNIPGPRTCPTCGQPLPQ